MFSLGPLIFDLKVLSPAAPTSASGVACIHSLPAAGLAGPDDVYLEHDHSGAAIRLRLVGRGHELDGTDTAVNWRDYGGTRWQLSNETTPIAVFLEEGWRQLLAEAEAMVTRYGTCRRRPSQRTVFVRLPSGVNRPISPSRAPFSESLIDSHDLDLA
jgi:hypothetical protein